MPPSSDQKSGGPSGSGGGTSARRARIRPPRRWAAASSGGKVAAADMSSTEPAWIPPISGSTSMSTTRRPSLRATSGPMARSPIGPRDVGPGQDSVTSEAQRTTDADDAGAGRRPEPGRDAEGVALGQRAQAPAGPDRRTPGRDGHQVVTDPHLSTQLDRLAAAAEESVRAEVDDASPDVLTLQRPAHMRRRLQESDHRRAGQRGRPAGQLPRRAETADAAADDDHAARRHLRVRHRQQ